MANPVIARRWDVQRYLDDLLRRMTLIERRVSRLRFDPPDINGVLELPILNADFTDYVANSPPTLVRRGALVEFYGALRSDAGVLDSGTINGVMQIPNGYRPSGDYSRVYVCQGSGNNRWTLTVAPVTSGSPGRVDMGRYGPGASGANTWSPFAVTWITVDDAP